MSTINNTQNAQKNSKGTAQAKARKVNVIEIDLTNSTNKVEDFCSRVKSSANNIDRFPDAEVVVLFNKEDVTSGRGRIQKYSILQDGKTMLIIEGDKRKRDTIHARCATRKLDYAGGDKSQWLLKMAETIIVSMHCFYIRGYVTGKYSDTLGINIETYNRLFIKLFPIQGKRLCLERDLKDATSEVMEVVRGSMTEGANVDGYTVIRANGWGVAVESKDGEFEAASWSDEDYFLPFKQDLTWAIRSYAENHTKGQCTTEILGTTVTLSLVSGKKKDTVVLNVGNMEGTFSCSDYKAMFLWVYDNRHEIVTPKHEILSYVGLYGTDKTEDVVSIAKDVLQIGFEFVRDDMTFKVVFRNDLGVAFTETSTEIINGTQFNNNRLVSFNWDDFQGWNNMPSEDMCSVDLKWLVQDGKATLIDDNTDVDKYPKVV